MNIICKNCSTHFKGHYCPHCGQKASAGRLKTGNVLHEFWHNFTHTDSGYLSLLKAMIVKPGAVIREYVDVKRKRYFNPYTFYLVTTAVLIFMAARVYKYEDELYDYRNEYGQYINAHYNIIVLCCMPVMALILQIIFIKKEYNYAEWITFLVFAFGLINFFQILMQFIYFPFIKYHYPIKNAVEYVAYGILLVILAAFIQPKKWWQFLQCILATVFVYFVVEVAGSLIALKIYGVPTEKLIQMVKTIF